MLNDAAIRNFLITVAGLVMMAVAIAVLARSSKAKFSEVAATGLNTLIGVVILAAGAGTLLLVAFGQNILETIFPSDSVADAPSEEGEGIKQRESVEVGSLASVHDLLRAQPWA